MKLKWPWRREGQPDAPGGREGDAPPVVSSGAAPSLAHYPLGDFLARNRALLIGGYMLVFAIFVVVVGATKWADWNIIVEVPHALFGVLRGDRDPWVRVLNLMRELDSPSWGNVWIIAAYLILQGIMLWGCGRVRLARARRRPVRPLAAIVAISAAAGVLTAGAMGILLAAAITGYGLSGEPPNFVKTVARLTPILGVEERSDWTVLWAGWGFWLVVALIYWRGRDRSRFLPHMIRALLTGSWIEFGLALPVDVALRTKAEDCPCATGSYTTLILAAPVLIWAIGPALYLLYLRERELSLAMPGRSTMILLRKSAVHSPRSTEARVARSVSSARRLSLAAIMLGLVGIHLGVINSERPMLLSEARNLLSVAWLQEHIPSDQALRQKTGDNRRDRGDNQLLLNSPFGMIHVAVDADGSVNAVTRGEGQQTCFSNRFERYPGGFFDLGDPAPANRLARILHRLEIPSAEPSPQLCEAIRDRLYNGREVLPGIDFGGFGTEQAAWLIALLCPILLIVLRNALRQVFRSPDAAAAEPWLIFDAETWTERAVGGLWLLGIALSGWLSTFGLIVTVVDRLVTGSEMPNPVGAGLAFLAFLVILILGTWPAMGAAGDLIRLREIRRDARRLAALPEPAAPSESPGQ